MGPLWVWALDLQPESWGAAEAVTVCQDLGHCPFGHRTWSSRQLPAGLAQTLEKQLRVKRRIHLSFLRILQREGREGTKRPEIEDVVNGTLHSIWGGHHRRQLEAWGFSGSVVLDQASLEE